MQPARQLLAASPASLASLATLATLATPGTLGLAAAPVRGQGQGADDGHTAWLAEHAVTVRSSEPTDHDFEDRLPLREAWRKNIAPMRADWSEVCDAFPSTRAK